MCDLPNQQIEEIELALREGMGLEFTGELIKSQEAIAPVAHPW